MALVLDRKVGEGFTIGDNVKVDVIRIRGDKVVLAITAPREVEILRDDAVERTSRMTDNHQNVKQQNLTRCQRDDRR